MLPCELAKSSSYAHKHSESEFDNACQAEVHDQLLGNELACHSMSEALQGRSPLQASLTSTSKAHLDKHETCV